MPKSGWISFFSLFTFPFFLHSSIDTEPGGGGGGGGGGMNGSKFDPYSAVK